ncbi:ArsR family transcriptional regulator [Nostoc sp. NIES-3756]|uniref:DUF2087 domain-containing protein n=1 Tax=Nostoc sp. NIES-3756 TaxID=1751286 RepID=UPI000721A256|nr:metalloregulator ArsR/SmtB family transcription factor [Nostoc sp. NIES-3756]BAT55622.1 ArsR family transcriptional regulator [Nostoc sp. NIES-3756]
MPPEQLDILINFFKALADENRLRIVGTLANQEYSVEELAKLMQLKESIVSHHLAKLQKFNLVSICPKGNTHLYKLDSAALQTMGKEIFQVNRTPVLDNGESETWSKQVLKNFFEGDHSLENSTVRLKEIPASRKKRLVILKWLANQFHVGVNYPEREVNAILQNYHPDYATLRRDLIDNQLMQRSKSIYWRIAEI